MAESSFGGTALPHSKTMRPTSLPFRENTASPALRPAATGVYSIDGRYMGNSLDHLGRGVYIVGGKKVYKK